MTVDFSLIFLFDTKQDLGGYYPFIGKSEVEIRIEGKGRSIFEQVRCDRLAKDRIVHMAT
jgi:hypothetical protein